MEEGSALSEAASLCVRSKSGVNLNRTGIGFLGEAGDIQGFQLVGHGFKNNLISNPKGHWCFAVAK